MQSQRAIILSTSIVRESDLLVFVLLEDMGKLKFIARGAKRSKKRFLGGLEIFDTGIAQFRHRPQDNTQTLDSFNRAKPWVNLKSKLGLITTAGICIEVTAKFCPLDDETCGELFKPLFYALRAIDSSESEKEALSIAIFYCLQVLNFSGLNAIDALEKQPSKWFEQMQGQNTAIIPSDPKHLKDVFSLIDYMEDQAGSKLNCRGSIHSITESLIRNH